MSIIGCDFHSRYQVVAMLNTESGEIVARRLEHANGEAQAFYAALAKPSRIGIEATAYTQWFERMLAEFGHELWVGDPAQIRARAVRRQKTDTRDAEHLLDLLLSARFPRLWVPTPEERDLRQLLKHRHKLVQMQTSARNQLHFLAMSQGVCRKKKLWSKRGRAELEALKLGPWASQRRQELLELLDGLGPRIETLDQAVAAEAGLGAARFDPELRRTFQRLKFRRGGSIAKVALARHLAVRLYGTLRQRISAPPAVRTSSSPSSAVVDRGPSKV